MVIYHSVVLQYFDAADRERFREMIEAAGREATSERPLAWLAYEQSAPDREFELTLAGPAGSAAASPSRRPMGGGWSGRDEAGAILPHRHGPFRMAGGIDCLVGRCRHRRSKREGRTAGTPFTQHRPFASAPVHVPYC